MPAKRLKTTLDEKGLRGEEILRQVYPRELVEKAHVEAYASGPVSLMKAKEFFQAYPTWRDWFNKRGMNQRRGRGYQGKTFAQAVNSLYPELRRHESDCTLHELITGVMDLEEGDYLRRIKHWCREELARGNEIAPYALYRGNAAQRRLFYALRRAAERYGNEHAACYTPRKFMREVLRLPEHMFMRGENANTRLGNLGELFVALLMKWTRILDPEGDFFQNGFSNHFSPLRGVHAAGTRGRISAYLYAENGCLVQGSELRPDLRIDTKENSLAGEVKTGSNYLSRSAFSELVRKYAPPSGMRMVWSGNTPACNLEEILHPEFVDGGVVFMLREKKSYSPDAPAIIKDAGLDFIPEELFSEYLERLVEAFEEEGAAQALKFMQPAVCGAEKLLQLYKRMVMSPHQMEHPGNGEMLGWGFEVLQGFVSYADEIINIAENAGKH